MLDVRKLGQVRGGCLIVCVGVCCYRRILWMICTKIRVFYLPIAMVSIAMARNMARAQPCVSSLSGAHRLNSLVSFVRPVWGKSNG